MGAFLFGAAFGVAVVFAFEWSFLNSMSQHSFRFDPSDAQSGFFMVLLIASFLALIIGLASGWSSLCLFNKLRKSPLRWLCPPISLSGYGLVIVVISSIQTWLNVVSNSGP